MENENKNVILVAYDFTGIGDIAIENATQMAKLLNYKIFLLHVINKISRKTLKKTNETLDGLRNRLKKIAEEISTKHSLTVEYDAKEGSIFTTIADVCSEKDASFLVFGTHGKKGIQLIAGSFAMKLVKSCPSPVFVVQKPAQNNTFKEVVFPLDLEAGSKQKVKWAISHNKQFNSRLHLFIEHYNDEYPQKRINADLNQVKKILEKHNIPYTENVAPTKGNFALNCVEFAKNIKADMIMLATDPDKITFSLLGSPDERLIYNQYKIPVMSINAQDLKVIIGGL
jgi:nucleotide-binding universal stress UspA family protein